MIEEPKKKSSTFSNYLNKYNPSYKDIQVDLIKRFQLSVNTSDKSLKKGGGSKPMTMKGLINEHGGPSEAPPKVEDDKEAKIMAMVWGTNKSVTQLITVDDLGRLYQWDAAKGIEMTRIKCAETWAMAVDFEPSECRRVAVGSLDGKLLIFNLNDQKQVKGRGLEIQRPTHELVGHTGAVLCCKFLSQTYCITGSSDSTVCLWDLENPQRYLSMHVEHNADVVSMDVFEEDGNIFLTGGSDLTTKIWDIRCKQPVQKTFSGHESSINTVKFLPGRVTTFASGSEDSSIRLMDLRAPREIAVFRDRNNEGLSFDAIYSIAFAKSGRILFAGTESESIKIWDTLGDGSILKKHPPGHKKMIKCVSVSNDGYAMASAGSDGNIFIFY